MSLHSPWVVLTLLSLVPSSAIADGPPARSSSLPSALGRLPENHSTDALAAALREHLLRSMPPVVYEASPGWGHTTRVATGLQWTGKGLHTQAHVTWSDKNDGTWRKTRLTTVDPALTLTLEFRNIQSPEPGRTTFDVVVACDARVECEQQNWKAGVRLYSGSAQARFRMHATLTCELTSQVDMKGGILPEIVLRLRLVRANVGYDRLVVEHIAGIGGDAARLLGDAIWEGLHRWRPSYERNLLTKANSAIEKAADTKEVHISLKYLLNPKAP